MKYGNYQNETAPTLRTQTHHRSLASHQASAGVIRASESVRVGTEGGTSSCAHSDKSVIVAVATF
eukprot:1109856-Rhodomonas_salina.2